MPKQLKKKCFAAIAAAGVLMLLFTGCAPVVSPELTAPPSVTAMETATPTITLPPAPTPTPTVVQTPTATPAPTPTPVSVSLPPIPENFLVEDEYWEFASLSYDSDGNPYYEGVYFVGFPEGMTLYAPMSGYVFLTRGTVMGVEHNTVRIAESADGPLEWDQFGPRKGRFISFIARGMELLDVGVKNDAPYVEKGKPFARIMKRAEVFPGTTEEKPELVVLLDMGWQDMLDVSVKDPREFMWSAVQILEEGKEN